MREIKFRAWDKKKILSFEDLLKDEGYIEEVLRNYHQTILMQYTGLNDKNGKEIYEGDIVEEALTIEDFGSIVKKSGQIFYNDNVGSFDFKPFVPLSGMKESWTVGLNCEVIGNIYENHDLIK